MSKDAFWNAMARGYAKRPISNVPAYEQTLDHVCRYLAPEQRALEVGCGTGSTALRLAPHVATYLGTDFASEMIAIAREKLEGENHSGLSFEQRTVTLEGIADRSHDVVLGFNIYHLVDDLAAALAATHRVLTPGGLFITKTPCLARKWYLRPIIGAMQLVGKAPPVLYLSPKGLEAAISTAGFDILETAFYAANTQNRFIVAKKR